MAELQQNQVKIVRQGNKAFGITPIGVYAFDVASSFKMASPSVLPFYTNTRQLVPVRIGEFEIVANGQENNYPDELRLIPDQKQQRKEQEKTTLTRKEQINQKSDVLKKDREVTRTGMPGWIVGIVVVAVLVGVAILVRRMKWF